MRLGESHFDCIVVGARCAGSPLAQRLAGAGMKVCLLDADKLPSDQPFSTHGISPLGTTLADELGVGRKIRDVTPRVAVGRISVGGVHLDLPLPESSPMYCPRRSLLDPLLLDAAVSAGAELHDETAVLDLVRDGERVVGVRARRNGKTTELRARWVVGADGRNSTVAKRVRAEEYYTAEAERGGYWSYFPITPAFRKMPFQTHIEITGPSALFAFQTDSDLVIAGAFHRPEVAKAWAKDPSGPVLASLARSEVTRHLVEGNRPATRFLGLLHGRWYFRQPVGAGWALVGDAGLHKDPTPGYGITDAFRDAKALGKALLDGRDAALEVYWRRRDVESLPFFENALAMGSPDYDNPFNELVIGKAGRSPALVDRLRKTLERTLSPFDAVPPWRVLAWVGAALLRGRTDVLPHFIAAGRRGRRVATELALRKTLLDRAEARFATT